MADAIKPNGLSEDIGAIIGFEATSRMLAVFGGGFLYVPDEASENHPIALVVGYRQMQKLCADFGSQTLRIPDNEEYRRLQRVRSVAQLVKTGYAPDSIADILGISTRQAVRYRAQAEEYGLLPMVMTGSQTGS